MGKLVQRHSLLNFRKVPALTDETLLLTGFVAIIVACGLALLISW